MVENNKVINVKSGIEENIGKLVGDIESHYGADVYLYNGPIDYELFGWLLDEIENTRVDSIEKRKTAVLILVTRGGDAMAAYMIARLFHQLYQEFIIFAPNFCKSAGTLIALGAHKILMDIISQFGPLDVQTIDKNNLAFQKSGLQYRSALKGLEEEATSFFLNMRNNIINRTKNKTQISVQDASMDAAVMTSELIKTIVEKIDPHEIGNDYRNLNIAMEYGKRLAAESKNLKLGTLRKLVFGYPSHDFAITKDEVSKMFKHVEFPCKEMRQLIAVIGNSANYQKWIDVKSSSPIVISLSSEFSKQMENLSGAKTTTGQQTSNDQQKGNQDHD